MEGTAAARLNDERMYSVLNSPLVEKQVQKLRCMQKLPARMWGDWSYAGIRYKKKKRYKEVVCDILNR